MHSESSYGDLNFTPSSVISANFRRLTIWNPPESRSKENLASLFCLILHKNALWDLRDYAANKRLHTTFFQSFTIQYLRGWDEKIARFSLWILVLLFHYPKREQDPGRSSPKALKKIQSSFQKTQTSKGLRHESYQSTL